MVDSSGVSSDLLAMLSSLAAETNKKIGSQKCQFGPTKGGSIFHYVVLGGKPPVIAWAEIRTIGRLVDKPRRPCAIVGIKGDLLNENESEAEGLAWKPNAGFQKQEQGGLGEWHGVTYSIGDSGYGLILDGLVAAAGESLRRAGG